MKRTVTALVAAAPPRSPGTLAVSVGDANAQWRRHGWGWGPGIAAGIIGGAIITGASAHRGRAAMSYTKAMAGPPSRLLLGLCSRCSTAVGAHRLHRRSGSALPGPAY